MKYIKKSIIIEAFQYDGDLKGSNGEYYVPDWAVKAFENNILYYDSFFPCSPPCDLFIKDLDDAMSRIVKVGDYIIKDIDGFLYSYKPDIFEKMYILLEG